MATDIDSPAALWRAGCDDQKLSRDDQKRFAAMARSRFHTFEMGIDHATNTSDQIKIQGLISGLAKELQQAPGLTKVWQRMAVSTSNIGEQVNLQLEKLKSTIH